MTDAYLRVAIRCVAADLFETVRDKCRLRAAEENMTLQQQLDMLVEEAMKTYVEPAEVTARFAKQGSVATGSVRDGKALAGGGD